MSVNAEVRSFWEQEPCGTTQREVGNEVPHSREWFQQVERYRYEVEPVIHDSEHPEQIVREIHRVLKPGGRFIGMMYGRHSICSLRIWADYALLKGRPWQSLSDAIATNMESAGTKAYTVPELEDMFASFSTIEATPILTQHDRAGWPPWVTRFFPQDWGFFIALHGQK